MPGCVGHLSCIALVPTVLTTSRECSFLDRISLGSIFEPHFIKLMWTKYFYISSAFLMIPEQQNHMWNSWYQSQFKNKLNTHPSCLWWLMAWCRKMPILMQLMIFKSLVCYKGIARGSRASNNPREWYDVRYMLAMLQQFIPFMACETSIQSASV